MLTSGKSRSSRTCSRNGQEVAWQLFGARCLWVEPVNPGYMLANTIREKLAAHRKEYNPVPEIIFLANHGIYVGGETTGVVKTISADLIRSLEKKIKHRPDSSPVEANEKKWQPSMHPWMHMTVMRKVLAATGSWIKNR